MIINMLEFKKILGKWADLQVSGFKVDSRLVEKGDIFFALKGKKSRGHHFLEEVALKGAIGAIVEKGYRGASFGMELFYVEDVLRVLQEMAKFYLGNSYVIGVTGSVGKTTTKEFIATLLRKKYLVGQSPKNHNSKIGLPLSILNGGRQEILVLEMGVSEKGNMENLVKIARPNFGVITRIGFVHSENFKGGISEIVEEKSKIFSSCEKGIYPHEFKKSPWVKKSFLSYSIQDRAATFFLDRGKLVNRKTRVEEINLPLQESHFQENLLIAYGVCVEMGMSLSEINEGMEQIKAPAMRFERIEKNGVLWIKDMYNACYLSLKAALLGMPKDRRRIGVIGAIKELGSYCFQEHKKVGMIAKQELDVLYCLGQECTPIVEAFSKSGKTGKLFVDKEALSQELKHEIRKGDAVLIKGSRSLEMETIFSKICD